MNEKGPDVLTLWGGLIDVVSFVPPERLRDSLSRATLARVMDRRAASRTGTAMSSNPVTNWAEVRNVARRWANLVRTRLDASVDWRAAGE
jgi:hypothetical protein